MPKRKRKTQKEAIKAFRKAHGNRYGYENVVYESSKKKVKIVCFEHGPFWQRPDSHSAGKGCLKCGREEVAKQARLKPEDALDRVKKNMG